MEDHPIQSLETEESNGECSHPDIQVVITLARAIIPSPGDDAMVVDEVGPGLDAMQTDDATAPSPVRSVHFASEMDVDYPVVSAPIYTPIPALAPAPASRGTAWVTWIISFFNFLPDVPAMGNMDLLQELTNLATAGWLPRTLTRGTDGPPDSPRRHRRRHRRRRSSSQRRSSSPGSSTDSPPRAQVLAPQNATPIRRGPRSYAAISNRRRIEAIGSMKSTLFRVSDLVPPDQANEENKANSTNTDDRRTDRVADTDDTRVDTVQMATDTTETTNPAGAVNQAGHTNQASDTNQGDVDNQPGSWSRWIFNSVSRRWTAIRGRVAPHGNETKEAAITETQRSTGTETKIDTGSDAPSTTPETPATDTVEASMMPVVLTGPSSTGHPPKPPFAHLLRPRAPSKYRVASNKARKRAAEAYAKELAAKEAARDAAAKEAAAKKAAAKKAAAEKAAAEKADSPQNQEDRDKRTLEKLGSELRSGKVNPLHLPPKLVPIVGSP
ncbi:hypothetical protein N7470_002398 [Penicillium chermesinum]|nr:hypothetical protein N7470_002398 [Penicillium chermesinum]